MPKIIIPTIGRRVWYWPSEADRVTMQTAVGQAGTETQACDAGIVYVHSDTMVNLTVADHNGNMHARTSVRLLQEGDRRPEAGSEAFAEWMPYQVGQAKAQSSSI